MKENQKFKDMICERGRAEHLLSMVVHSIRLEIRLDDCFEIMGYEIGDKECIVPYQIIYEILGIVPAYVSDDINNRFTDLLCGRLEDEIVANEMVSYVERCKAIENKKLDASLSEVFGQSARERGN